MDEMTLVSERSLLAFSVFFVVGNFPREPLPN